MNNQELRLKYLNKILKHINKVNHELELYNKSADNNNQYGGMRTSMKNNRAQFSPDYAITREARLQAEKEQKLKEEEHKKRIVDRKQKIIDQEQKISEQEQLISQQEQLIQHHETIIIQNNNELRNIENELKNKENELKNIKANDQQKDIKINYLEKNIKNLKKNIKNLHEENEKITKKLSYIKYGIKIKHMMFKNSIAIRNLLINKNTAELSEKETKIIEKQTEIEEKQSEILKTKAEIEEKQAEILRITDELSEKKAEIEEKKAEIQKISLLYNVNNNAIQELENKKQEIVNLQNEINRYIEQNKENEKYINELTAQFEIMMKKLNQVQIDFNTKIEFYKDDASKKTIEIKSLKRRILDSQFQKNTQAEIDRKKAEFEKNRNNLTTLLNARDIKQNAIDKTVLNNKINYLEAENSNLYNEINRLQQELDNDDRINELNQEHNVLKQEINYLNEKNKNCEEENKEFDDQNKKLYEENKELYDENTKLDEENRVLEKKNIELNNLITTTVRTGIMTLISNTGGIMRFYYSKAKELIKNIENNIPIMKNIDPTYVSPNLSQYDEYFVKSINNMLTYSSTPTKIEETKIKLEELINTTKNHIIDLQNILKNQQIKITKL